MNTVYILTDYKGFFGSKQKSLIYKGGMDLEKLRQLFISNNYSTIIKSYSEIDFRQDDFRNAIVLYTSSEERHGTYKDYIEDILLGIKLAGGILLPDFFSFRAHNNKVFMEILRDVSGCEEMKNVRSKYLGTIEDLIRLKEQIQFPVISKPSEGSMSKGIRLNTGWKDLIRSVKKIAVGPVYKKDRFKEHIRRIKYKGYVKNTSFPKKYVLQNFVENLENDWKVVVMGSRYYVLKRYNRKHDFRASGGGLLEFTESLPDGLLDFSEKCYASFQVPSISLDIGYINGIFHLFEFQFIYFGTYTLEYSNFYFKKYSDKWHIIREPSELEIVYFEAIHSYIVRKLDW